MRGEMYVRKIYAKTKTGAAKRNHRDGNQEYDAIHQEFLATDQEVAAVEAEKQQTGTEAAAAARKDSEHH